MTPDLKLEVAGTGSRYELAKALRLLADALYSEHSIQEIYDIDAATWNNEILESRLKQDSN